MQTIPRGLLITRRLIKFIFCAVGGAGFPVILGVLLTPLVGIGVGLVLWIIAIGVGVKPTDGYGRVWAGECPHCRRAMWVSMTALPAFDCPTCKRRVVLENGRFVAIFPEPPQPSASSSSD